ncbi:MAG: cellobiohydrolase [Actinobacteria bacterium]|uniref:Unannotated protein n=1 Tax=freshwater metagenome TaxID=449393 RepID=A0A6J6QS18_9ZZZZ|nr:cellobiohydrolase [Actinomycetota bacterium]
MPDDAGRPPPARRRASPILVALLVVVLVVAGAGLVLARERGLGPYAPDPLPANPFEARPQYVDPESNAVQAARQAAADGDTDQADVFTRIAAVPSGIWLTPEEYPPGAVGPYVAGVVAAATLAEQVPLFVVYGIPDRDCTGGFSSGGLSVSDYVPWVQEIATAAASGEIAAVVVEPDALVSTVQCRRSAQRIRLLEEAVGVLATAGVATYVDGGHADWVPAATVARLLEQVGVDRVRGFSTNVSNYQSDADELAYAERVSRLLGGAHWVTDRGRNGNGSTEDWCNPPGRALGDLPGFVDDDTDLDAYLWIKPPGESDGDCHGGPPAGEFWPTRAFAQARAAGW